MSLRLLPEVGGSTRSGDDDYVHGLPELVAEIAASSASSDLRDKLQVYGRTGVCGYHVWLTKENVFDWFLLDEDLSLPLPPHAQGVPENHPFTSLRRAACRT